MRSSSLARLLRQDRLPQELVGPFHIHKLDVPDRDIGKVHVVEVRIRQDHTLEDDIGELAVCECHVGPGAAVNNDRLDAGSKEASLGSRRPVELDIEFATVPAG